MIFLSLAFLVYSCKPPTPITILVRFNCVENKSIYSNYNKANNTQVGGRKRERRSLTCYHHVHDPGEKKRKQSQGTAQGKEQSRAKTVG